MGAGEDDKSVGVEVFALIQWRAIGVDAVEPATVFGIVKMLVQRAEQRRSALRGVGEGRVVDQAGEQIQLPCAGHGAIALGWQRPMPGAESLKRQRQISIPAGALPQGHNDLAKVLLHCRKRGGQFKREVGAGYIRHRRASSRLGRLCDMIHRDSLDDLNSDVGSGMWERACSRWERCGTSGKPQ